MRHLKFAPRLTPIDEDLTASMMIRKQRGEGADQDKVAPLPHKMRRVIEIVRTPVPKTTQENAMPVPPSTVKITESSENAVEPVTLQPLRNRADTALTAAPPVLLVRTASGNIENKYKRSVLHDAVRKGDIGAVKHLVATQPELLGLPDIRGNLPLHYAANGKGAHMPEIVFVLLKAGAAVNAVNERQQTALLIHVIANTTDDDMIARILLHHQANPRIQMTDTLLLSDYATARGLHQIATALTEYM